MNQPPSPEPPRVGRYALVERLAIGGMAEIFLACERGAHDFERLVVIKKILPHLAQEPQFVQMFLQEARTVARISHPNVVQIIELGEDDDQPFIAMEYVQGCTLRELTKTADQHGVPVPVGVALALVTQALAGAHAVHDLSDPDGRPYGLVHRDLTPHNLMVTREGFVKLLDFGIVKATEGLERTRTGVLKGKLSYMSPEQARQEELDRRSDLFTLGIVLWELLAGEKLFAARSELGIMQAIVTGAVRDLGAVRADVPTPVLDVVSRALALDPDDRFPTADAFRRALLDAAERSGLRVERDAVAAFTDRLVGPTLDARRKEVGVALERTHASVATHPTHATRATSSATLAPTALGALGALGALALTGFAAVSVVALGALVGIGLWQAGVLDEREPPYVRPPGEPVELTFAPTVDAEVLLTELEPLRRYLEQATDTPIDFTVAPSYGEASRRLVEGEAPFASIPPFLYVQTRLAEPRVEVLAIKQFDGSNGTDGVLLVPEGGVTAVADLAGKRICYTDPGSTTGYLLPRRTLRKHGIDPDSDFDEVRISGNHLQLIRDVAEKRCDVGGTYAGAFTTAAQADIPVATTRVLAITGRTPHDAFVAGPSADPELRQALQDALLAFDPLPLTGEPSLGEVERLSGFLAPDSEAYLELQHAVEEEAARVRP